MVNALDLLNQKLDKKAAPKIKCPPPETTFNDWLHTYAKVKVGNKFVKYSTKGREPLANVILMIDYVLGNDVTYANDATRLAVLGTIAYGEIIKGAEIDVCGGAQFGKTILALLLKTYLGTVKFRGVMYCLPDDDLVQGIIDLKERPEVIDQIPYVSQMLIQGKELTPSGKAVNRKGAMLYTNGESASGSMMRGLGKFPTTFTCDVVIVDERDDVKEEMADYLPGRMTVSDLQLMINIGTQRWHGAGQNAKYEEGSQHVGHIVCACCREVVPEEDWPAVVRLSVTGHRSPQDPQMTPAGNFARHGETVAAYNPNYDYYFACPGCGAPLDRTDIHFKARQPETLLIRQWSIRVSQMSCSGLPVDSFVHEWCTEAVKKKRKLAAFACDRLAIPQSADQELTPAILDRAEQCAPYEMRCTAGGRRRWIGIDTGDQCWITVREEHEKNDRLSWAEHVADSDCENRAVALYNLLNADCLFIDAGPLRTLSRNLALRLNGCDQIPVFGLDWEHGVVRFPGGVEWDGKEKVWRNLKAAPVEFTGRPGSGIQMQARLTPDGKYIYPVISCNRDEAIQGMVDDLRTAEDGFAEVDANTGELRQEPKILFPLKDKDDTGEVEILRKHFLAGSKKSETNDGKERHFVDGIANHLLLAATYGRLAKMFQGVDRPKPPPPMPRAFTNNRRSRALERRKKREVLA